MSCRALDGMLEEAHFERAQVAPVALADELLAMLELRLSDRDPLWSVVAGQMGITLPA